MGGVSRGDVVLAAMAGDYGKLRPWLVVQADQHNRADRPDSILVCPLTSHQEAKRFVFKKPIDDGNWLFRGLFISERLLAIFI